MPRHALLFGYTEHYGYYAPKPASKPPGRSGHLRPTPPVKRTHHITTRDSYYKRSM